MPRLLPLVLAVGLGLAASATNAAPLTLEQALTDLSARYGWNYLLGPGVSLSAQLDSIPETEDALSRWLERQGVELVVLETGDRELRKMAAATVSLAALPITASAVNGGGAPLRSGTSSTVVSAEDINNLGDTRLDQLFTRAANVFGNGDEYYFRGVASGGNLNTLGNAAAVVGSTPLAGVVLANLPLSTWDTANAGFDRGTRSGSTAGPFSAYSGRISITPQAPSFSSRHRIRMGLSDLGDSQVALMANTQLIPDELALRASVDRQIVAGTLDDPGTTTNPGLGRDFNESRNTTGRLAALWEPASRPELSVTMDLMAFDGRAGPQRISALDPFGRSGRPAPFDQRRVDGHLASLEGRWRSADNRQWQLALADSQGEARLTPIRPLANTLDPADLLVDQEQDATRFAHLSHERTLGRGRVSASVSWGRNANVENFQREQRRWQLKSSLRRQTAGLSLDLPLSGGWSMDAGLRYTRDRLQRSCQTDAGGEVLDCLQVQGLLLIPADGEFEKFTRTYTAVSPELALSWSPRRHQNRWFLRLAQGYNAGGAVSDATFSGEPFWIFYGPERARSGELGWQGQLGNLALSVTGFHTALDQQWLVVQDGLLLGEVTNNGRSRNQGLELDGRWQWRQRHQLSFSIGLLDTQYDEYVPFETDALLLSAAGNRFPGAPRFSGSLNWRSVLGRGFEIGAGLSFHDSVEANANNPDSASIPAVAVTDLRLAWRGRRLTAALVANNLFDRNYHLTTPNVVRRNQRIDYLPGRPRNIALTLEYQF